MVDHVHDIQHTYRQLVTALSRPGTIVDLSSIAGRIEPVPPFNPVMMLLAMTLLDGETGFSLYQDGTKTPAAATSPAAAAISHRTYARVVPTDQAGYVFVLGTDTDPRRAIESAHEGTLIDPHLGATVFLEVGRLRAGADRDDADDQAFQLRGPGIDGTIGIDVESRFDWYSIRNERVSEYPLGVDMFLADRHGSVMGLPRTTRLAKAGEVQWAT